MQVYYYCDSFLINGFRFGGRRLQYTRPNNSLLIKISLWLPFSLRVTSEIQLVGVNEQWLTVKAESTNVHTGRGDAVNGGRFL